MSGHHTSNRPCPVCDSTAVQWLFHQSFEVFSEVGLLTGYDVVVCDNCGTGFADGIPSQTALDEYYRDLSKYDYELRGGKESPDDELRLQHLADIVASAIPARHSRILEIGCANGKFLSILKRKGFENVWGLDPSPLCTEAARKLYDIEVVTNSILDLAPPAQPFDVVIALGVLEHIRDLRPALNQLRKQLREGGAVFVGVPDAAHLIAQYDAPYQEFSTEHINFFSGNSIVNLMQMNGFRQASWKYKRPADLPEGLASSIFAVFSSIDSKPGLVRDDTTLVGLSNYIADCKKLDEQLRGRIAAALRECNRIIVWGVGTHTRRLLAQGVLADAQILAFVDSSPKYRGHTLNGRPVICPQEVVQHSEPILISSYAFQTEIAEQIRTQLRAENKLILLYDK
jgi:2-polyprenyl-3-methyl-5-hydroxy-6-metoxy-1,4-benzoquinol methylase